MKFTRLFITALASVALGACSSNNKSAESGDSISHESAGMQGKWRLESYRVDCESTQLDSMSNYLLSFNDTVNIFSLSTDCNMINGEYETAGDTISFKNMLVTEMACESMTVEQDMLRLLNDSTAYAVCQGDTLAFTAPTIGTATFIKQ